MWRRRRLPLILGLLLVILLGWIRFLDPYPTQALRDITFDNYQRLQPRAALDFPVRIIDFDEATLAEFGQWPPPRDLMATLATRLTELGAASVVFDVLFPEPDRSSPSTIVETLRARLPDEVAAGLDAIELSDHDAEFALALAASPSVLGFSVTTGVGPTPSTDKMGFAVVGPPDPLLPLIRGASISLPTLVEAAYGLGAVSLEPGGNVSVLRRLPLLWSTGSEMMPALSLEALRVAFGAQTIVVFTHNFGNGTVTSVRVGDREIPTTPEGFLWLYYQSTPPDLYLSAANILGENWADFAPLIAGNIVFIGTSAAGLYDIRGTPIGVNMPGVEIHAQAVQQILAEDYLVRADVMSGIELLAFAIASLIIIATTLLTRPLVSILVGGFLAVGIAAASWFAFAERGFLIDPSFPLLGALIVFTAMIFLRFRITDADKRKIRTAFGTYVDPALLAQIEWSSAKLQLGGETRELSIMFSDVRNFTTVSETFDPPGLVAMLNTLFGALGTRITEQYGTIDKFIGDAIMAFWNAPVDVERHAFRACSAALGMRRELEKLNAKDAFRLRADGRSVDEIWIGIGISTGEALVGNLGLETRFDYSCVGDTVNVASRVEGACKTVGYDIVVVEATRRDAAELAFLEAGSIALKGKSNREPIHILVGDAEQAKSAEFQALEAAHNEAVEALRKGLDATSAIDKCMSLITFSDRLLANFYETMRDRTHDFDHDVIAPSQKPVDNANADTSLETSTT